MTAKTPIAIAAALLAVLACSAAPALAAAPEKPETKAATVVTATTATLNGVLNKGAPAKVHWSFAYAPEEYGTECVDAFRSTEREAEAETVPESVEITELEPHREYMFCLTASNAEGETFGNEVSFVTEAVVPGVANQSVPSVTPSEARVEGTVNAENESTTCVVQYGLVSGSVSEKEVPCSSPTVEGYAGPEGLYGQRVSASITGLEANKPYLYRILATNTTGASEGTGELTTLPNPPIVSTGEQASGVTVDSATISGSVNPNAAGIPAQDATKYSFQYGTTISYGHQVPGLLDQTEAEACKIDLEKGEACPSESEAGEGEAATAEQSNLVGLEPGTTYHYRIVASNAEGRQTSYGADATFTTTATPPILSGVSVQGVTQSTATITATLEAQGLPTRYELQLGSTPGLLQPAGSGTTSTTTPLSLPVESLSPGTVYYYKLTAINANGPSAPAPEGSFATAPAAAGAPPSGLPATIPYQSIAQLNAKEAQEAKSIPSPIVTKSLTKAEKLKKALKACNRDKGKTKRQHCERQAHEKYPTGSKKKVKKK